MYDYGFSIHNAGMLRKDRNIVESLFRSGHVNVLVTTATLAWGINMPAYATIIKGTKIYDASAGQFKDIGAFDMQQIFGRAGRPQYDKEGEGILLTTADKVDNYVRMMTNKQEIESNLLTGLASCLNAEVACGCVTSMAEAVQWIKFTYLYRRCEINPRHYGIDPNIVYKDGIDSYLYNLCYENIMKLHAYRLIRYHE